MIRRSIKVVRITFKAVVFAFQLHRAFQATPAGKAFEAQALHTVKNFSKRSTAVTKGIYTTVKGVVDRSRRKDEADSEDPSL